MKERLVTSKSGNDPRVYLQKNNKKHWVINKAVLMDLGFEWEEIQYVDDRIVDKLVTDVPITSKNQKVSESSDLITCIENTWSNDRATGVSGWVVGKNRPVKRLVIEVDGRKKNIQNWTAKPEIFDYFSMNTDYHVQDMCGFMIIVPKKTEREIVFKIPGKFQTSHNLIYDVEQQPHNDDFSVNKNLEEKFRNIVNKNRFSVLEVGSRISPGGINKRKFFKKASSYVGIDYLPGKTVDVVGDAHELSKFFNKREFDALYSDSVLEHLAMPWKAVIEMNKVLKRGGYVFHSAPACWVPHDMPWDFWRFSDAGMKSLFSEAFGFKVIDTEYSSPVSLHINGDVGDEYANFPVSPAFGFVSILAQKTHNINKRKLRFDFKLKEIVGKTSYPEWSTKQ